MFIRDAAGGFAPGPAFAGWNDDLALGKVKLLAPHVVGELWQGVRLVGLLGQDGNATGSATRSYQASTRQCLPADKTPQPHNGSLTSPSCRQGRWGVLRWARPPLLLPGKMPVWWKEETLAQASIVVVGSEPFCSRLTSRLSSGLDVGVASIVADRVAHVPVGQELATTGLVVIEARLPDGRGLALCAEVAEVGRGQQIMMVDERDDGAMAVQSLLAGAVDYFPRPDNHVELMARVRAHMRNYATSLEAEIEIGPFTFKPGSFLLTNRQTGDRVRLTRKEAKLLRRLHLAGGQVVLLADLVRAAWGAVSIPRGFHTLQTHVYRLRTKLGAGHDSGPIICTATGGYAISTECSSMLTSSPFGGRRTRAT